MKALRIIRCLQNSKAAQHHEVGAFLPVACCYCSDQCFPFVLHLSCCQTGLSLTAYSATEHLARTNYEFEVGLPSLIVAQPSMIRVLLYCAAAVLRLSVADHEFHRCHPAISKSTSKSSDFGAPEAIISMMFSRMPLLNVLKLAVLLLSNGLYQPGATLGMDSQRHHHC